MGDVSDCDRELARWSHQWFVAAFRQAQRAVAAIAADDDFGAAETELLMFVDALNNSRRGASAVLGRGADAVQRFDREVPRLKSFRDQLEHHDEYATGLGNMQKAAHVIPGEQWWTTTLDGGLHWSPGRDPQHCLRFGLVSKARDPDDASALIDVASAAIDVVPSARACCTLVATVLGEVGIPQSNFLAVANSWCDDQLRAW